MEYFAKPYQFVYVAWIVRKLKAVLQKPKNLPSKQKLLLKKGGKILLRNCGRDKYFRLLCDVKVNGQSLGEELIKAGHAIPYDGGTKTPFLSTNN
ncbi:thermonuclease family protein [Candidatus Avelusimicrobium fimicolum]|uniref:thermonuclease family protein n=1 Tax=Candidatus Avelusimicrobium fimicolum TaxID=3416216 RepID=UPI0015B354ED